MGRLPGSKNTKKREPKTARTEALYIVRSLLDRYAACGTELNYQMVLNALAFLKEIEKLPPPSEPIPRPKG